jgi:hypothetical protein
MYLVVPPCTQRWVHFVNCWNQQRLLLSLFIRKRDHLTIYVNRWKHRRVCLVEIFVRFLLNRLLALLELLALDVDEALEGGVKLVGA